MKRFECPNSFAIVIFIPMEARNYRKPTANVFPHEIMLVGIIVYVQDLGFMIYKIICFCGVLLHFLGQCTLKRTRKYSQVHEDGKDIFQH